VADLATAEKVMSKEILKHGYCASCDENVTHRRGRAKGLREVVGGLLQKLQLGRWHCVQCQSSRYFLPFVNKGTVDYQIQDPSDALNLGKQNVGPSLVVDANDFSEDWGPSDSLGEDQGRRLLHRSAQETQTTESSQKALRGELLDPFDFSKEAVFCRRSEDDLFCEKNEDALGMAGGISDNRKSTVEPQRRGNVQGAGFVVAEPVGNFIKDQSLVVEATRLKRFTEKYRDALVDRILSGKAQISWLIADGKYTEAELVSWIADKERRETAEPDAAIELNAVFRKHD